MIELHDCRMELDATVSTRLVFEGAQKRFALFVPSSRNRLVLCPSAS
jgi:hypothetical protein